MQVLQHKVVASLPVPLQPNSIYYVRKGTGFDINVTNDAGIIVAYSLNANLALEGKVDKELGYSLLPNTEITRLATVSTGATKNRADSENANEVHTHTAEQISGLVGEWVDLRPHLKTGFYWDTAREGRNSHPRIRKLSCGRVELDGVVSFNEISATLPIGVFVNVPSEFRPPLTLGGIMFGDTASPLSFGTVNWIAGGADGSSPPHVHGDIMVIPLTLTSPAQYGALSLNGIYWFTN